jgi:hypothetical protein
MTYKKGDYVLYTQHRPGCKERRLIGQVVGESFQDQVNVKWINQCFPVIGWPSDRLEPASAVDVLACVGATTDRRRNWPSPSVPKQCRRKKGFAVKLTGAVLMALRYTLAHHIYEHPKDDEMRFVLDALPRPDFNHPKYHFAKTIPARTLRIPPHALESYIRAFKLAASTPHLPQGSHSALERRIEKLESYGPVDQLGRLV